MLTEKKSMVSMGTKISMHTNISMHKNISTLLGKSVFGMPDLVGKHNVKNNIFGKTNPILSLTNPLQP